MQRRARLRKRQKKSRMNLGPSPDAEEMQKLMDDLIIHNFITSKDVPAWFRGSSQSQLDAVDRLHDALEDDMEQETSHRVYRCLQDIGLTPMVKRQRLKLLMRFSRGNDLALLWFLLEAVYKEDGVNFNINEQLIMSSIAHLDMITTMRALDRILPPPQFPNETTEHQSQDAPATPQIIEKPKFEIPVSACVSDPKRLLKLLPYFQPQTKPNKPPVRKLARRPDMEVNFGFYDRYKDPHYKVPNESTRWFADHVISVENRVAHTILKEEIGKLLAKYENKQLKQTQQVVQDLRHSDYDPERNVGTVILEDMLDDMGRGTIKDVMCAYHRSLEDDVDVEKDYKLVAERERCLAYINAYEIKKEKRREVVRAELAKNVEKYLERYRIMRSDPCRKCACKLLERNSDCVCCIMDDFMDIQKACVSKDDKFGSTQMGRGDKSVTSGCSKRMCGGMECASSNKCQMEPRFSLNDGSEHISRHNLKYVLHSSRIKPVSYFRANTEHLPYIFHYGKIFQYNDKDGKLFIKKVFLKELKDTTDEPDQHTYENIEQEIGGAALKNAAKMWTDALASENNTQPTSAEKEEMANEDEAQHPTKAESEEKPFVTDSTMPGLSEFESKTPATTWREHVAIRYAHMKEAEEKAMQRDDVERLSMQVEKLDLGFKLKYYDPKDNALMNEMLKRGLAYLARYPKYVLAGIQDADKLPVLRYWIAHRYGKRYSYEERRELFYKVSKKIFKAMDRTLFAKFPLPTPDVLNYRPPKGFADFSLHKQLRAKANQVRAEYHQKVDDFILEYSRLFWLAMRSYLCGGGPPRHTYFAYMPARHVDIFHHHLWNRTQVRDVKEVWANRVLLQEKANRQAGRF